jgi:hypothetical protein
MMFNYWSDKVSFNNGIKEELYPRLADFFGEELTEDLMSEIKKEVSDWIIEYVNGTVFDCEIKVEVETKKIIEDQVSSDVDIVKFINVVPIDV